MPLPNTIVLPEDTKGAETMLKKLLVNPAAAVYLFLWGDSAEMTAFAAAADGAATGALRKVVRRSQCADVMDRFDDLELDLGLPSLSSPDMIGFSTSGHLIISDVIRAHDELDAMRAADAFIAAEGQAS